MSTIRIYRIAIESIFSSRFNLVLFSNLSQGLSVQKMFLNTLDSSPCLPLSPSSKFNFSMKGKMIDRNDCCCIALASHCKRIEI